MDDYKEPWYFQMVVPVRVVVCITILLLTHCQVGYTKSGKSLQLKDYNFFQTEFCPASMIQSKTRELLFFNGMDKFGLEGPTTIAVPTGKGVKVIRTSGENTTNLPLPGEAWILCWFEGGRGWDSIQFIQQPSLFSGGHPDAYGLEQKETPMPTGKFDVPWLIVMEHRPETLTHSSLGVRAVFPSTARARQGAGRVLMMPLYGSFRLSPKRTRAWKNGLPEKVIRRCRQWTRMLRRYPVSCEEDYSINTKKDEITIRNTFKYINIQDDWKTKPLYWAPVSPMLGLAWRYRGKELENVLSFVEDVKDMDYVTPYGPLYAVLGRKVVTHKYKGLLKYINHVPSIKGVEGLPAKDRERYEALISKAAELIESKAIRHIEEIKPRKSWSGTMYPDGYTWEVFAMNGESSLCMAKLFPYLPEKIKNKLRPILMKLLQTALDPDNYISLRDEVRDIDYIIEKRRFEKIGWGDAHFFGEQLINIHVLAECLDAWKLVSKRKAMLRKMVNAMTVLDWVVYTDGCECDHPQMELMAGMGLARLSARIGDSKNYAYGSYLAIKYMITRYATIKARDYVRELGQWCHYMDPKKEYVYFRTPTKSTQRPLHWACNSMGIKFFDTEIYGSFGWLHTFTTVHFYYSDRYSSFLREVMPSTMQEHAVLFDEKANPLRLERLTDGNPGLPTHQASQSVGWQSDRVEVVIDLGKEKSVEAVRGNVLRFLTVGIELPRIEVSVSSDGKSWTFCGSTDMLKDATALHLNKTEKGYGEPDPTNGVYRFRVPTMNKRARFVRVVYLTRHHKFLFTSELEVLSPAGINLALGKKPESSPPPNYSYHAAKIFLDRETMIEQPTKALLNQCENLGHAAYTLTLQMLWKVLYAAEGRPVREIKIPTRAKKTGFMPGLHLTLNETRAIGIPGALRLNKLLTAFSMISRNIILEDSGIWPMLCWYGYNSPQSPCPFLDHVLSFGFVAPGLDTAPRAAEKKIAHSCNLFQYSANVGKPFRKQLFAPSGQNISPASVSFVDLTKFANQGFRDEKEGDGKGGWTDQGKNDLREMITGEQVFCGIPFRVLDPKKNRGRSCLILRGQTTPFLPEKIEGIPVGRKFESLVFLYTSAWADGNVGGKIMAIQMNYSDNRSEKINFLQGLHIADWWKAQDLPNARVAWKGKNEYSLCPWDVGLYAAVWKNPRPDMEIRSIDFLKGNVDRAIPILISVTGAPLQLRNFASGKKVSFSKPPNYEHKGQTCNDPEDPFQLTDGKVLKTNSFFMDPSVVGWCLSEVTVKLDLGKITWIERAKMHLISFTTGGVYFPSTTISVSEDGKEWREVGVLKSKFWEPEPEEHKPVWKWFISNFAPVKARYVRFRFKGVTKGGPSYIFCDEVTIEGTGE